MEAREPKIFKDILELQKILDDNLHNVRERTLTDIQLSLIAECIEFNEETKDSHKTWKTKKYNSEKELEELTDIWFFYAQMVNYCEKRKDLSDFTGEEIGYICSIFDKNHFEVLNKIKHLIKNPLMNCISFLLNYNYEISISVGELIYRLIEITFFYGYTKDDILKTYWIKWQKNMERIGKEWN